MVFRYFCYGSNMLTKRMHINCPSAKRMCIAKLKDFRLAFAGFSELWKGASATIIESPGDTVWGVVWEIAKEQEEKLDRQENGYKAIEVAVEQQDCTKLLCKTYVKLPTSDNCSEPSLVYKTVMIYGAREHQFPEAYVQQIENFKDNGCKENVDVPLDIIL